MPQVVLGVDSSTQSTKVEARELDSGRLIGAGTAPHPPTTPPVSEQHPDDWWSALVAACAQLPEAARRDVVAISVAGQQHGLVLLDERDIVLRPAKLWNDTTSANQAARLVAAIGAEAWARSVGSVPVASFTITKLAWILDHEADLAERVARVMLPHDYLTFRLTGAHVTDRGDASGTGWFDPVTGRYRSELLDLAGVIGRDWLDKLPIVLGPEAVAGTVTPTAATALGLPDGVLVGAGSGDNMGSALGLGLAPGDLVVSLGTSGVAYARSSSPARDVSGSVAGFADAAGGFLPLVCTLNATKVTDAVAGWLGTDPAGLADLALASDETEVILVPWFDGERTPNRPDVSGTLFGLRTSTTRAELALAAHDGVLCGLLNGVDALAALGIEVGGTLHLIGGGARSGAYRQRCADLWQRPITIPANGETVATGAAVQAAGLVSQSGLADLQTAWALGAGATVKPRATVDAKAIRDRYRAATT